MSKKHEKHSNLKNAVEQDTLEALQDCEAAEENPLQEQLDLQKDKYVRLMAEFDNFKKRTAGEYAKMVEQANKNLIDDLIEIRETFQKALSADHEAGADAFKEGVSLIYSKFDEILAKHGLENFGEIGDDFDPSLHDAMMKQTSEDVEEGKIAVIFQKGYKLKNNIIRHAKVVISSGKEAE